MAQKRIKIARYDISDDKICIIYNDGSHGEISSLTNCNRIVHSEDLIGLTLKQAKIKLGIKS